MTTPCPTCATLRASLARSEDEVKRLRAALARPPGGVAMRIDARNPLVTAATDLYLRTQEALDRMKTELGVARRWSKFGRANARFWRALSRRPPSP